SRFANQLQQGITQKEQELNEANTSFSKEKIAKLSAKLKRAKTKFEHAMASAMRSAAEHGHIDLIKYALKKQFISINQKCEYTTLLAQATESGQDNLMQFLLDNGADPEEGLYIILIRIVNSSYNSILKHILKPGVFTLLKAIEKRGELKSIKLIQQCSVNGRLDLLVRLFDLDQGRLIKPDTIQKLLSKDCPVKCRNFLQKKLAQAQSAIALKASAEEQPNDSSSDEAEDFFRAGFQHPAPRIEFAHSHFFASTAFQATATDQAEEQPNDSSSDEAEDFFRAGFQHPAPRIEFAHSHFFASAAFQATVTEQAEEQPNDSSSDEAEDFFRAGFQHPAPRIEFAHSHFFASAAFQATVTDQDDKATKHTEVSFGG
uniref:ankyrin repeat domain-containing protein n=1 Tax=Legionella nautarum TaxID=45070 RepID=UPI0013EF8EA9